MPPALETDRLLLRPFDQADADAAYAVLETHPDVWKHDPGFQRTREQRAAIIAKYATMNQADGCGTLAVVSKATQQLIGYVGLQLYILPRSPLATPEVELYYKLGRDFWGQGYAAEASRRMLDFAFGVLRLRRVVTITAAGNDESIRLLRRLGMQIEAAPAEWDGMLTATLDHPEARLPAANPD
jgi:RimJ/RimL family protein N-acetyltransferase